MTCAGAMIGTRGNEPHTESEQRMMLRSQSRFSINTTTIIIIFKWVPNATCSFLVLFAFRVMAYVIRAMHLLLHWPREKEVDKGSKHACTYMGWVTVCMYIYGGPSSLEVAMDKGS